MLFTLFPLLFAVAWLYGAAYDAYQMAPNSAVILTSADWVDAVTKSKAMGMQPLEYWLAHSTADTDYETFNRFIYAVDLFVPLDALGQETTWAPAKDRGTLGWMAYYARMPIQVTGWLITALAAGVLTGLVGRRD